MATFIILLRGVTPTGKNSVLMAPLREALEAAAFKNVRTYIQSGNIVATSRLGQSAVETRVHDVIAERFGGDIAVLARTPPQFREIFVCNPFREADTAKLYFTLLAQKPDAQLGAEFVGTKFAPDEIRLIDDVVYVRCATKYSDIKPNNGFIERKLKVTATTRNYNTMSKLIELSGD